LADSVKGPKDETLAATRIATRKGYPHEAEEDYANARLIAAAPDLLDALRDVLESAKLGLEVEDHPALRDIRKAARAAIAKAKGE
jgi:hypothetical protein